MYKEAFPGLCHYKKRLVDNEVAFVFSSEEEKTALGALDTLNSSPRLLKGGSDVEMSTSGTQIRATNAQDANLLEKKLRDVGINPNE